jgi:ABC-type phosphate transport system substrate-binding protein
MWNDPRIVAQNTPEVVALLPEETIRVVIPTAPSDVTLQFTTLPNATVPAFADAVGAGCVVDLPVASSRDAVIVDNQESIPNALVITIYGFTFLEQPEAQLVRTTPPLVVDHDMTCCQA